MAIELHISDKLDAREKEWNIIQRCLAVNLCPRCGSDMVKHVNDQICVSCAFSANASNFFRRMYDQSEVKSGRE